MAKMVTDGLFKAANPKLPPNFDRERMIRAATELVLAAGLDLSDENLADTPRRLTDMYSEMFAGLARDPLEDLNVSFPADYQEMVIVRDIPFYSVCAHHFLPFFGHATVAYLPKGRVAGLSKLARVVETFARRPQLQERMTSEIANAMMTALEPDGCAVVLKAEHLCMTMRGIKKPGSQTVTSANRGTFRDNAATRAEFMSLLDR